MAKKYSNSSAKPSSSVREQPRDKSSTAEPRYATAEMMEKAVTQVMKIHGEALRKLAQ
jgi:hypothetical protein